MPEIKFVDQRLTSFAGMVVFQPLLAMLQFKNSLRACFKHLQLSSIFGLQVIMMLLVLHILMGYRKLRDIDYYKDDPIVKRLLGLNRLPDVATVSRALRDADEASVTNVRQLCRSLVLERLKKLFVVRLTLDFDGSVISTSSRKTEGTAVGFNKKKKGARSYYPLFCTLAQTGQVFDFYHRPGNVHDSNGAREFITQCIAIIRKELPGVKIEVRMDSAFFSDEIVGMLDENHIEFSLSVPFERFVELKKMIEGRRKWKAINGTWSYFESGWKPKSWDNKYRFIFVRQKCKQINKEPIQLDLFIPQVYGYEFKVIITNKSASAKKVLAYHNGRGSQESVFGELKSQGQMDYIAVRGLYGNQLYMLASIMAHNLNRELQMVASTKDRGTTEKRAPLFKFEELRTIRHRLLQRAGRLTRPQGTLTLTMSGNKTVRDELLHFLDALGRAA
jgi:hypothetical protein